MTPTDALARTIWGEARGCGAAGMLHVASVVLNRAAHPGWWGHDIASVCRAPEQFSCWNAGDPNRAKLEAVTADDPWFSIALGIAADAVAGRLADETGGADSYYALSMKTPPSWAAGAVHTYSDGWHSFWRVEGGATNVSAVAAAHAAAHIPDVDTEADVLNAAELQKISEEKQG